MNICFSKGGCTTLLSLPNEWLLDYKSNTDTSKKQTLTLTVNTEGSRKKYCLRDSNDYPDLPASVCDMILFRLIKKVSQYKPKSPYETIDIDILETIAIEELSDIINSVETISQNSINLHV